MATTNEENKEKQLTVSGEQIEEICNKKGEIEKNTADIADLITKTDETSENLAKLQDVVVTDSNEIAALKKKTDETNENLANVYTKEQTDSAITEKVSEIVSGAPEDFDTLKEMSDWLTEHSDSAAAMNTAIQENASDITGLTGDVEELESTKMNTADIVTLTEAEFAALTEKTAPFYFIKEGEATV